MNSNEEDKINFIDYPLNLRFKMRGKRKLSNSIDDACNISGRRNKKLYK